MITRHMLATLQDRAKSYPVVSLTGPRQSGKTTLVRAAFPRAAYANLEDPEQRDHARSDPKDFLLQFPGRVIIDEAQRVPDLFSWIQVEADRNHRPGRFILTGSHNFLLMRSIRQSLAGRSAVLHLHPLAFTELAGRRKLVPDKIGRTAPRAAAPPAHHELLQTLHTGFYPRIHDRGIPPQQWLADYSRTYVERDVREILSVGDLEAYHRFVSLCAGRTGQLLNLSSLASDCGITHPTARSWLSVLEAGFLVTLLRPHHRNFNKRLIKRPKLYFLDTGLLCYLLRIRSPEDLRTHHMRGQIFESFVVSEFLKAYRNAGLEPDMYFWRDSSGHEVDLILDHGETQIPIEIKSGRTFVADFLAGLHYWRDLAGLATGPAALIHGGDKAMVRQGIPVYPWWSI